MKLVSSQKILRRAKNIDWACDGERTISSRARDFGRAAMARLPEAHAWTHFAEARDTLTLDEAYTVQMEVARLRCAAGDAVVGYKSAALDRRGRAIRHDRSDPRASFSQ